MKKNFIVKQMSGKNQNENENGRKHGGSGNVTEIFMSRSCPRMRRGI